MRKHVSHFAIFAVLLALLSGCASVGEKPPPGPVVLSDELFALLEMVNVEHRAIVKPEIDEEAIVERWARDPSKYSLDYQPAGSMIDGVLTAQQAKNDVNVLFYSLQTKYGLYEYFGGDEVFDLAKEAILQACDVAETLTPDELRNVLSANLAFVNRDAHFYIGWPDNTLTFPFHFRTTAFEKTDNGYQTLEGKKQVSSVDGYENLDSLFRRSISNEGAIVYYPVVLVELDAQFPRIIPRGNPTYTPRDLVVRFADGTTQLLTAEPFQSGQSSERFVVEMYKNRGIPVLFSGYAWSGIAGEPDRDGRAFLAYAEELKGEHVLIMDLRSNRGGIGILAYKWLHAHLGRTVTGNSYFIQYNRPVMRTAGGKISASDEFLFELLGLRTIGGITLQGGQLDEFVENENLIIALIGKGTASAAELMVDLLHNVGNVLFVGDLTYGCYVGEAAGFKLPLSQISVGFGNGLRIFPEGDYFQEMRGFFPDLWVPAAQAEELALKLILGN